ncbi:ALF repeat-containing protein [Streptomyces sp. WAC06614]|uniref:ALF repeat-containing protein n=1 Tax=Streptomyces sp. WAC06614 TaxID=2487416 RepID=UPI000F76A33D|nr:ALF repeat-containing protein [Streptomyces sp. WAC06614]RSS64186.1 hypothetical protein EF918_30335 [Streptomyces sp. WAC06614]
MKLSRIAAAVTAAALAPAVLLSSPAFADGNPATPAGPPSQGVPDQPPAADPAAPATGTPAAGKQADKPADKPADKQAEDDRLAILAIIADPTASEFLRNACREALKGTPAQMRAFLENEVPAIRLDDARIAIARLDHEAGPILRKGINDFFHTKHTLADALQFLAVTQHELRDQDNRVLITQIISTGGPEVKEKGRAAMNGSPKDRAEFLKTGQHTARDQDNRVLIAQIVSLGGPEVKEKGRAALNGTPEDRVKFLETGQHEARAKDKKAEEEAAKNGKGGSGSGNGNGNGTGNGNGAGGSGSTATQTVATGNSNVSANGGGRTLAATGAGEGTTWAAGAAGTALVAGTGLVLAARRRRPGSAA